MTPPRRSLGKFCQAGSTGSIVESLGNMVAVRLRTDASVTGRGFHLRYSTLCDTTITGLAGVIESPNFPEDYPYNRWGGAAAGCRSPRTYTSRRWTFGRIVYILAMHFHVLSINTCIQVIYLLWVE